ncbi:hypothetical protein M9M90_07595 [Phenylobacterium sp. LH3H17]|uniref:hypothetical protein n=1 Tax=Phenylobacterium sp. LH3H17 TaxID=2903901 RepID=UPI0020C9867F|nr:hypothetical protein [Phenylobacterium sp. LH3H17]UTP41031.1 hypothetical protein M9M90_07595 [Phenylobacterium sp. LH3H17]
MIPSQTLPELPSELKFEPKSAIYVPLGAASPFWFLYAGAASAGVAYWWFSRWRQATNLEALFAKTPAVLELETAPAAEPQAEAPEAAVAAEPQPEPAFIASAELLSDVAPVVDAAPAIEPEPVVEAQAVIEAAPEVASQPAAPKAKTPRATRSVSDEPA